MSTVGWIVLLVFVVPALGLLVWLALTTSLVQIPQGELGLVLRRGRPTPTVLTPGLHYVSILRRRTLAHYPMLEMSYRCGDSQTAAEPTVEQTLDQAAPPLAVGLGDGLRATVSYTVRFALDPAGLPALHQAIGPDGVFGLVRDVSRAVVAERLGRDGSGLRDLVGATRLISQADVADHLRPALAEHGLALLSFYLVPTDLGTAGALLDEATRAPYRLAVEEAVSEVMRVAATTDRDIEARGLDPATTWRYREAALWQSLLRDATNVHVALRNDPAPRPAAPAGPGPGAATADAGGSAPDGPSDSGSS